MNVDAYTSTALGLSELFHGLLQVMFSELFNGLLQVTFY